MFRTSPSGRRVGRRRPFKLTVDDLNKTSEDYWFLTHSALLLKAFVAENNQVRIGRTAGPSNAPGSTLITPLVV
jgi:hypothetical protein